MYINDVIYTCDHWKVRVSFTRLPKNDYSSRKKRTKPGMYETIVEVGGYWDRDTNPHIIHGIVGGAEITGVKGYLIKAGILFSFSTIVVVDFEVTSEVDGRIEMPLTMIVNGGWSYPGGTLAPT